MGKMVEFTGEWHGQEPPKAQEIKIRPEFRDLIPPLEEEERIGLEKNLLKNGCEEPIKLWNGWIVDGHNRYEICTKHNIPFRTEQKHFKDDDEAKVWMIDLHLDRRNLTAYARGDLIDERQDILFKRRHGNRYTKVEDDESRTVRNLTDVEKDREKPTRKAAEAVGISHDTYNKIKYLKQNASEEDKQRLKTGDLSINKAYVDLRALEKDVDPKYIGFPQEETYGVFYCDPYVRDLSSLSEWDHKQFITEPEKLPVSISRDTTSALFLWSPAHLLENSLKLMKTWGFEYEDMLIWNLKEPIESHQVLNKHIFIIIGTAGGCVPISGYKPITILEDNGQGSRHDQVREIIEKMYPDKKKLELLSHEKKEGWDLYTGDGALEALS